MVILIHFIILSKPIFKSEKEIKIAVFSRLY